MKDNGFIDYYEVLQVSPSADPDMIHRVYRLLAQRYHPDNRETGNQARFVAIDQAYSVLSDPPTRAQYDVQHQQHRQNRLKLVSNGDRLETEFAIEQHVRVAVLKALYAQRRLNGNHPGIFDGELEGLVGTSREHLEFTFWYLMQKRLVARGDHSQLAITAEGVDYLEQHYENDQHRKRLNEKNDARPPSDPAL